MWEKYKKSKKQYTEDKKDYEAERAQTKFLKTPAGSDAEEWNESFS